MRSYRAHILFSNMFARMLQLKMSMVYRLESWLDASICILVGIVVYWPFY